MKVLPVPAFNDNYIWLIIDEEQATVCCVDPGDAKPVIDFVNKQSLHLKAIILTHHHHDHIGGVSDLLNVYPDIAIYGPEDPRIPYVTHPLKSDACLTLSPCNFQILITPGHTSSHISLYEPAYGWLFCGDTLFSAGCGRVFDGTIEELYESLNKLRALPDQTKVFCAHEYTRQNLRFAKHVEPDNSTINSYAAQLNQHNHCSLPSTIALEKEINPFFRADNEGMRHYAKLKVHNTIDPFLIFRHLRADKDSFS